MLDKSSLSSTILLSTINEKHAYIRKLTVWTQLLGLLCKLNTPHLFAVPSDIFATPNDSVPLLIFDVLLLPKFVVALADVLDWLSN